MQPLKPVLPIDVQAATIEDSEAILALWQGSARWLQAKGINQWHPDYFRIEDVREHFRKGDAFFMARCGDDIVGTLYVCWSDPVIWGELDNDDAGYIHRFAVSRAHQGSGVGEQLLRWAENYILGQGKNRIRLDCMADNERLNRYYVEHGYVHIRHLSWDNGWKMNLYEKS